MIVRSQKIKASGGYGNSIKSCGFREGDEVKILTPDYGRGGKWYTEEYRQGKVIFVSDYFITVETICGTRVGRKVPDCSGKDWEKAAKIRYTYDRQDLFFLHILPVENGKNSYVAA